MEQTYFNCTYVISSSHTHASLNVCVFESTYLPKQHSTTLNIPVPFFENVPLVDKTGGKRLDLFFVSVTNVLEEI
jgi:hypothetical protein